MRERNNANLGRYIKIPKISIRYPTNIPRGPRRLLTLLLTVGPVLRARAQGHTSDEIMTNMSNLSVYRTFRYMEPFDIWNLSICRTFRYIEPFDMSNLSSIYRTLRCTETPRTTHPSKYRNFRYDIYISIKKTHLGVHEASRAEHLLRRVDLKTAREGRGREVRRNFLNEQTNKQTNEHT